MTTPVKIVFQAEDGTRIVLQEMQGGLGAVSAAAARAGDALDQAFRRARPDQAVAAGQQAGAALDATAARAAAAGLRWDEAAGRWRTASGQVASGAELAAAGLAKAGQAAEQAGQQASGSSGMWERLGGVLERVGGVIKTSIIAGATALAVGVGAAGAAGLAFNNSLEQTSARIQAFTKDSAATADILDMVRDRAAKTPFAFEEMASATAALMPSAKASGEALESLIAQAEILAASNPAEGLEGAAFALKEALSGDFESIVERFNIPRQELNKLKEQGVPALQAVQKAMKDIGLDADLVTGLGETASGRWSTFKDTLVGVAATATKPLFDTLSRGLGTVNGWLSQNQPLLDRLGSYLAGTLSSAISTITALLAPLAGAFQAFTAALQTGGGAGEAFVAGLNAIIPGLGDIVGQVGAYGSALVSVFADGITAGMGAVADALGQVGALVSYWLEPHSPPALLPEIDVWGAQTAQVYLDAFGTADPGPAMDALRASLIDSLNGIQQSIQPIPLASTVFDLSGGDLSFLSDATDGIRTVLKSLQDVGQIDQVDVIPRLLGGRDALVTAINDMRQFGSISENTMQRIASAAGPLAPQIANLVSGYAKLRRTTEDVARAQEDLNRITSEYDAKLRPLNDKLRSIQDQKQAIDDQIRVKKLQEDIASGNLDDLEVKRAQLEIEEIQARAAVKGVEDEKNAAVSAAQAKVKAAQDAQKAAQDSIATAKAQISAYAEQNSLLKEQADLLKRLADAGARGGGGGGRGGGGVKLPARPKSEPAALTAPDADMEDLRAQGRAGQGADEEVSAIGRVVAALAPLQAAWQTTQAVASTASTYLTLIGQNLASIFAGASGSVRGAIASIGAAWNSLAPTISAAVVPLTGIVQGTLGTINAWLFQNGPEITAFISTTWTQIGSIISGSLQLASGVVLGVLQLISEYFQANSTTIQTVLTGAWGIISNTITGALALISGTIQTALAIMRGDWTGAWQSIQSMSATFVSALGGVIKGGLELIASAFGTSLEGIRKTWSDGFALIKSVATKLMADTITALSGMIARFVSIGSDIVAGVVRGISSAAGSLMSAMRNLAQSALNEAKSALGISSPSAEMADIAKWIPPGLAMGILQTGSVVGQAIRGLMQTAAATASEDARKLVEEVLGAGSDLLKARASSEASVRGLRPDAKAATETQRALDQLNARRVGLVAQIENAADDPAAQRRLQQDLLDLDYQRADAQAKLAQAQADYAARLQLQQRVQEQLGQAAREAQALDPRVADEYYKTRQQQILELARLEQDLASATDRQQQDSIKRQMELLREAGAADLALLEVRNRNAGLTVALPQTGFSGAAQQVSNRSATFAAGSIQINLSGAAVAASGGQSYTPAQVRRIVEDAVQQALARAGLDIDGRARVR